MIKNRNICKQYEPDINRKKNHQILRNIEEIQQEKNE